MRRQIRPIQGELFGRRTKKIVAASARAVAARDGKHSARAVLMNLLSLTNRLGRKRLTIHEVITAERKKTRLSVIILENILKAIESKKETTHSELKSIQFSLGRIKSMKHQFATWERQVKKMGENYNMSRGRFQMYKLLHLDPIEIFEAETYLRTSKTNINSNSPIAQHENIIRQAAQMALRFTR